MASRWVLFIVETVNQHLVLANHRWKKILNRESLKIKKKKRVQSLELGGQMMTFYAEKPLLTWGTSLESLDACFISEMNQNIGIF